MAIKSSILVALCLLAEFVGYAQPSDDTWGNVPPASDDRFSNPKSKLYAGPNGWFNYGEVRATVSNAAKTRYAYKGGFQYNSQAEFTAVEQGKPRVLQIDFGTERPAPGTYQVSSKADPAGKKVYLSFSDTADGKLRGWDSSDQAGTVTVSLVNKFLYVKCRSVALQPTGIHNTGDLKNPMTVGFEGAIAPR
jgi:hypothetical protein